MEDLIKELKELRATLKGEGFEDWCYSQLTVDKAIKVVENCNLAYVMHRFYMQIAKDHNVPTERILLAITDNGKDVQAYSTNLEETEIIYLQYYSLPNGA